MKTHISLLSAMISLFAASAAFAGPPPGGWASVSPHSATDEARSAQCEGCQLDASKEHAHRTACHSEAITCPACETTTKVIRRGSPSRTGVTAFAQINAPAGDCPVRVGDVDHPRHPEHSHCG